VSQDRAGGGIDLMFTVKNTGPRAGSDVPQAYAGASPDLPAGIPQAVAKLVGFQRVTLAPGQSRQLILHVGRQQLASWSPAAGGWVAGTGNRTLFVGSSSRGPKQQTTFTLR
jgi:beta-glucosidase